MNYPDDPFVCLFAGIWIAFWGLVYFLSGVFNWEYFFKSRLGGAANGFSRNVGRIIHICFGLFTIGLGIKLILRYQ